VLTEATITHQEREHEAQRGGIRHGGGACASERADALGVGSGRCAGSSGRARRGGGRGGAGQAAGAVVGVLESLVRQSSAVPPLDQKNHGSSLGCALHKAGNFATVHVRHA
jgi:hypothetical protein